MWLLPQGLRMVAKLRSPDRIDSDEVIAIVASLDEDVVEVQTMVCGILFIDGYESAAQAIMELSEVEYYQYLLSTIWNKVA